MAPGTNDIRYVCISDLHLGEEDSLLTHVNPQNGEADPSVKSLVLQELATCLNYLIVHNEDKVQKATLILLGDVLELALTNNNIAAMAFERFLELFMAQNSELFEKIIYLPGNHDHHLWESARETQYVLNYLAKTKPNDVLEPPWHTTYIFMEGDPNPVPSFFLNGLMHRYPHLQDFEIQTAYPNFGLRQGNRCVLFHHGHFIESIYQLMTTLKNLIFPKLETRYRKIWDLESENFAWIDFFWSTLGRSGKWGQDVETIYEKMQSEEQFRKLLNDLAHSLAEKYDITGLGDWMNDKVGELIINGLVNKLVKNERSVADQRLSPDAEAGLSYYLNFPLWRQVDEECAKRNLYSPHEATFVFGHTHKPFEEVKEFAAYREINVPVYNTGGWVVETTDPAPLHGGAVVLLNENLDCASLRLYNEADEPGGYQVAVNEVLPPGRAHSDFFLRLQDLVQPDQIPWSRFSETVATEVSLRARRLKERINT
jgi:UDP-2,3-diacylglucosamine pyrophosphatase LpxH